MTETEQVPTTNGLPEETEEDDKTKIRPPDIDADMREMERRKRVEMLMSSRLFREELERIIESQMKEGGGPAGLLQQIQDMVGGASRLQANVFRGSNCVLPINDIRGLEAMGYAKGEKVLRCKLASVFRLMDLYGWSHGIHNLITGRLAQDNEEFVVNPHGLMYHEVTASSLVKVDMQGNVLEQGTTNFNVNTMGFKLHAALHAARPDIKCVIHVRNPPVLAISSLKCGLLPVSAESAVIGEVSNHQYIGSAAEPEERDKIARSLGPVNKVLLLNNHGALCCGETIEEAFFNVYNTVLACETQVKLMPLGVDNLMTLPDEGRKALYDTARKAPVGDKKWRVGGLEFEALMRMLDNAGFRTGYIYRSPLVKNELPKPKNDVEVPPAVSSLGYLLEEEEMYRNWKKGGVNRNDRSRWLNSPNVYQKVEILETGTTDPKKITKWVDANNAEEWVADGSPAHTSTPVKIDAALQFVPKNTNPKEFKKLQQQIKENRRADKITSGPQSHILEGVTWEEAKKLQDANISMTGDQVILVGAASKGIIQRGFQHNATVYKSPYAKNPFDCVSEQELEEYKNVVTKKQKGEYYGDDTEQSESEALSSSVALIKSEQEDSSEPRVLRIETKTAPAPSQAEVVLSDDDFPDPHVERSKSHRYPTTKVDAAPEVKRSSSADRAKKDVGDGQVVKCRLFDDVTVMEGPRLHSVGTQTKLRIYSDSEESSREDNAFVMSKSKARTTSIPDIVKIGLPQDRFETMSKVIKELTSRFEKVVREESITSLEVHKPISVPGSPTGFSSDDTAISFELSADGEPENINKSVTSLQDHIGEDFEATIDSDSTTCAFPSVLAKQSSLDLTANYIRDHYNDFKSLEKVHSSESLFDEQDNASLKTYVSSTNISLIDIHDSISCGSNSSLDDIMLKDRYISEGQQKEDSSDYKTAISSNDSNSSHLTTDTIIIVRDLTVCETIDMGSLTKETTIMENIDYCKIEPSSKRDKNKFSQNNSNTTDNKICYSCDTPSKKCLDVNSNTMPEILFDTPPNQTFIKLDGSSCGYDADIEGTFCRSFESPPINLEQNQITNFQKANNSSGELITSFYNVGNYLYTIDEEISCENIN